MANDAYIQFRCTKEFKQKITLAAEKESRSLSNYIIYKLEEDNKMKTKYEVIKNSIEISYSNRRNIMEGCTVNQDDCDPEIIKSFDSKEDALKELQKYDTDIRKLSGGAGTYYSITEYYVEENTYDDDKWVSSEGVCGYSKMNIEVCEKPTYEAIGVYNNYSDAEKALCELDDGYISF